MLAAMDVGGTNIRCHIIDDSGKVVGSEFMETQNIGLIEAIESILNKYQIDKIGISYAGQISKGVILTSPNIKVDEPNIQAYFLCKKVLNRMCK
jgi:predicted NBD/HSP70 family sugar kinase